MQLKPIEITIQGRTFKHLLEQEHQWAIRAAVGAQRPLLVLGEPGVGKSQLALAASVELKRPLIRFTVDSNTEATDLLYRYDSIRRLAEAQIYGTTNPKKTLSRKSSMAKSSSAKQEKLTKQDSSKDPLGIDNFVFPGPLWWALAWDEALQKAPLAKPEIIDKDWTPKNGIVILIDEIDKADAHVPNGLLEVLAENRFLPLGRDVPIQLRKDHTAPLIVITSNQDRILPPAFIRRCVVLKIELPGGSLSEMEKSFCTLSDYLERLGRAHFDESSFFNGREESVGAGKTVYKMIAEQLAEDRLEAIRRSCQPYPGPAEYLDILRAICQITQDASKSPDKYPELAKLQKQVIADKLARQLRSFIFNKSTQRS